ncbi:MAG: sigma 54-interacting transcriptional regulator [Deltaproteobacteria bacterium]|nr:sigma 54-interacting transcriptional regulator [Deltaproteobacteria bacterium]
MPALFITQPDGVSIETFPLTETETRIGAGKMNQCRLDHRDVVGNACAVVDDGGRWWLIDKTTRGIQMNGFLAREVELTHGAEFQVGPYRFRFDGDVRPQERSGRERGTITRTNPLAPDEPTPPGLLGQLAEEGAKGKKPYTLDLPSLSIGRDRGRDIILNDDSVSADHCAIFRKDNDYFIVDMWSTNGTFVNDLKLERRAQFRLPDGAKIKIGNRTFVFRLVEPAAESADEDGEIPVFEGIVGGTPAMKAIFGVISKVAPLSDPVLISGETGTGKELVARALHNLSHRKDCPYMARNCATVSRELFESTFFGHEKGAFTGAQTMQRGVFEEVRGGTLFLDEIGEMPLEMQAKLLRVLDSGDFHRVGSGTPIKMHARIVAATNRNLAGMVEEGTFRRDLLKRLDVFRIHLPPLRERKEDIFALSRHFIKDMQRVTHLSQGAYLAMLAGDWTGNVRDLRNAIRRADGLCEGTVIQAKDLDLAPVTEEEKEETEAAYAPNGTLVDVARKHTLETYEHNGRNIKKTARELGIGRTTLKRKLREWGLKANADE